MRGMGHEIGHRQFAGENESGEAGEQADDDENATDDFKSAGKAHEREDFHAVGKIFGERKFEIFSCTVLEKEQAGHDAQGGVKRACPGGGDNSV